MDVTRIVVLVGVCLLLGSCATPRLAATDLYASAAQNPMTTMAEYGDRRIEVVGVVKQIGVTQQQQLQESGISIAWTSWFSTTHGSAVQKNTPVVFVLLDGGDGEVGCFISGELNKEDYEFFGGINVGQKVLLQGETIEIDSTQTPPVVALGDCWLSGVY